MNGTDSNSERAMLRSKDTSQLVQFWSHLRVSQHLMMCMFRQAQNGPKVSIRTHMKIFWCAISKRAVFIRLSTHIVNPRRWWATSLSLLTVQPVTQWLCSLSYTCSSYWVHGEGNQCRCSRQVRTFIIYFWTKFLISDWNGSSAMSIKQLLVIFIHIPCISILSKYFYSPTNEQVNCLKTILKFTLKLH